MAVSLTINGVERSGRVIPSSVQRTAVITSQPDTLQFTMRLNDSQLAEIPSPTQEVILTIAGTKEFGGIITARPFAYLGDARTGEIEVQVTCQDYQQLLARKLATRAYQNATAGSIVIDLAGIVGGFNTANVQTGPTLTEWKISYQNVADAIENIARSNGYDWWVDYDKNLYFQQPVTPNAAWNLTEASSPPYLASAPYGGLRYLDDVLQVRNVVYVKGATTNSNIVTQRGTGTGSTRTIALTLGQTIIKGSLVFTVGGIAQTVGAQGEVDPADVKWIVDYDARTLTATSGTPSIGSGVAYEIKYRYENTIVVRAEDVVSTAAFGTWEHALVNPDIKDRASAQAVAKADLQENAFPDVSLQYTTTRPGLVVGKVQTVDIPRLGITGDYLIKSIVLRTPSYLSGNTGFQSNEWYRVWDISAQRLGQVTY